MSTKETILNKKDAKIMVSNRLSSEIKDDFILCDDENKRLTTVVTHAGKIIYIIWNEDQTIIYENTFDKQESLMHRVKYVKNCNKYVKG